MRKPTLSATLFVVLWTSSARAMQSSYAPYNEGKMDPQPSGWPLTPEGKAFALKPDVNVHPTPLLTSITINGVKQVEPTAKLEVLTGQPDDQNTIAQPDKVTPKLTQITTAARSFTHEFPAFSVTVMRLKVN